MQTIRTGFIGGRLAAFIPRAWLANPLTREFTTACVRWELVPRSAYEVARARIA